MAVLQHPSRALPTEAMQYMSQYLIRAQGSETGSMFHEGVWPPGSDARRSNIEELEPGGSWIALCDLVGKAVPLMGAIKVEGGNSQVLLQGFA